MRPSSLGGGRILRRTLSVRLSVCPSVRPSRYCFCLFYSRTVLRANIQNRKTSVFAYGPASRMYFSARTEGRISYGHLGRTNSCLYWKVQDEWTIQGQRRTILHIMISVSYTGNLTSRGVLVHSRHLKRTVMIRNLGSTKFY